MPVHIGVPNEAASERFRVWNERLGGVISDTLLPNMPVGAQLLPIKEAVKILKVWFGPLGLSTHIVGSLPCIDYSIHVHVIYQ